VTGGAAQTTFGGGSDVFISKPGPDGGLIWCTSFGGSGSDGARGIGVDAAGNVTVAGQTDSLDLPVVNAMQAKLDNGHLRYGVDGFVAKVDATGSRFLYATYLGGDGDAMLYSTYLGGGYSDAARAVAVDPQGNIVLAGQTYSDNFPVVYAAQPMKAKYDDAFVTKIAWQ
jgi:hypothetical protein